MGKRKKGMSLKVKTLFLIFLITILLVSISLIVSNKVHTETINSYYKSLVRQIGRSTAGIVDADNIGKLLEIVDTDEYQQLLKKAAESDDESFIIDYFKDKDMYDDYIVLTAQLDRFRSNMEVEYIYIMSVYNGYSIGVADPDEGILYLGTKMENAGEFAQYTTNDPIPATVSRTEFGWLCSGYESVTDSAGNKIAVVGVDINMNDIVAQREEYIRNLAITMGIYILVASGLSMILMNKVVVKPLDMLARATSEFVKEDNYSLDSVADLPLQTGDEIEELYVSIKKLETDIIQYIDNLTKVTAEKERIGAELNIATQIQADMLPNIFPAFPDRKEFDIFASMTPAKEVGGDFYDFFMVDNDHIALVMADVSGKGVPAALFMVIAKTLIKNRTQMGGSPSEILSYVNEQLCEGNEAELFVTVWLGILEISTGKGIAANAGHEHPTIRRAGGNYELVKTKHSPAVAAMEGMRFREHDFELHPGDSIFVYTDGVAEATNAGNELFGTDRMLDALNEDPTASAEDIIKNVSKHINNFVGDAPQFDDITMLCIDYFGNKGSL